MTAEGMEESVVDCDAVGGDKAVEGVIKDSSGDAAEPALEIDAGEGMDSEKFEDTAVQFAEIIGGRIKSRAGEAPRGDTAVGIDGVIQDPKQAIRSDGRPRNQTGRAKRCGRERTNRAGEVIGPRRR